MKSRDKQQNSGRFLRLAGTVAVLATSVAALSPPALSHRAQPDEIPLRSVQDLSTAFEHVATALRPSVVSIESVNRIEVQRMQRGGPGPFGDSPLDRLLEPNLREFHRNLPPEAFVQEGRGTGVVVSEDGYILTNNHVVKDADEVNVRLWDDSEYRASVVGTDPKTDLAVLRIDAHDLHPAPLGDDSTLRVGHWVVAMGDPFGLSATMTAGIVSAVGRSRVGVADYEDFIQTDAAINPGNSGGPLVNLAGEVVGINTAIFSRTGGSAGIGFAIPINMARSVMDSLIQDGHVERGFLGVVIQNLDKRLAASFGYEDTAGALVSDLAEGGPAEQAGIRAGDIIVRLDGQDVRDVDALRLRVAESKPGTEVSVDFYRDGERLTRDVEIGALEPEPAVQSVERSTRELGLGLQTLTPQLAGRLDLREDQRGVLVTGVEPFGAAARAGLRLNDVILSVGGSAVEDVTDFDRALAKSDLSEGVRLVVLSGSSKRFVLLSTAR